MHWISGWPDIRPDNPALFDIRYGIKPNIWPDIRQKKYAMNPFSSALSKMFILTAFTSFESNP
jgi:hypothetical protein